MRLNYKSNHFTIALFVGLYKVAQVCCIRYYFKRYYSYYSTYYIVYNSYSTLLDSINNCTIL